MIYLFEGVKFDECVLPEQRMCSHGITIKHIFVIIECV